MAAEFKVASAYADFEVKVDEGIDKAKARIKERQRDLDASAKIKLTVDLKDAKAQIRNEFRDERFSIKADADTTLAQARLKALTGDGKFTIKPDLDAGSTRKMERDVDSSVSRAASRANAQFNALAFTGLTVGLPAAAAVGAAGVTASLAVVAGGFAAFTVAMTRSSDQVSAKWSSFSDGVIKDSKSIAAPLQGEVVGAIDDMSVAWTRLKPSITAATVASAPAIRTLTGAVTDLAENAMPGLVIAAKSSGVAVDAVRVFAGQAGAGLSEFFVNASRGAPGAAQGFTILGGTIRNVESRLGSLLANFANGSAGPLRSFDVIVDQVTGALVDMTAKGSGVIGFLQGFSTAGSGLATVLRGVVAVATALPPQITQLGGSFMATSMLASKFGLDAGKGFEGLGSKVKAAEGATGKLGAAVGGLAAGAINPAFLAVSALSLGLSFLGAAQEKAAQYAQEHAENVRGLTDAIRQDNGVLGEATRAKNAQALADKNAAANLSVFGQNISTATAAINGSTPAYNQLASSSVTLFRSIAEGAGLTGENATALMGLGRTALETGQNYDQMKDKVKLYGTVMDSGTGTTQKLTAAQQSQIEATINGLGAIGEQINSQRQAREAYLASEAALTGLTHAQIEARDATVAHTQAALDAVGGELAYRSAVTATKDALDALTKTNKDHKATEDDKAKALLGVESAMHNQVLAAGQAAAATALGKTANEQAAIATAAMNRETVNLANTWQGPLPASLQSGIAKMNLTEAKAAGVTVAIDGTGAAVYRLPNGKTIKIESTADQEAAKIAALRAQIDALHNKDVKITVTTFYGTEGKGSNLTGPAVARAGGGLVGRLAAASGRAYAGGTDAVAPIGGGLIGAMGRSIRDTIPALLAQGEHVTNALQTARNYRELAAINNGQRNYEQYPNTGGRPPSRAEVPAPRSAEPVVNNIYITAPPEMDYEVLAAKVSREIALRGK